MNDGDHEVGKRVFSYVLYAVKCGASAESYAALVSERDAKPDHQEADQSSVICFETAEMGC